MSQDTSLTLTQRCFDQIQQGIIKGTYRPGEKLKIDALKREHGVGHTPIREALSRLTAWGLVDAEENKGFRVAKVTEAGVRDVYWAFTQVELLAMSQAIAVGDDSWEAQIVATLHQLGSVEKSSEEVSYEKWSERNLAFHQAIVNGCGSDCLLQVRQSLYLRFDRFCRMAFYNRHLPLHLNHEEHRKLAEEVLARDVDKARARMIHHIEDGLPGVLASLRELLS